uniref:UDP-glucuronosyltransferase n=1 Tax=Gouania willdenowi TaxID=441366 RepID=A0A8C5GI97_GOUWI
MELCVRLIVVLLLATLPFTCSGEKVLLYPFDGSHWVNMELMVKALRARGHEITVLRSSTSWYVSEFSSYYTSITVKQDKPQVLESQDFMTSFLEKSLKIRRNRGSLWAFFEFYRNLFSMVRENQQAAAEVAISIFENKTLLRELEESGFDLFLTDPVSTTGVLVAHYLQLPLVFNVRFLYSGEAHMAMAPSPLSYIPALFSQYSDRMDFYSRLKNMIYHGMIFYMYYSVSNPPFQDICEKYFGADITPMSIVRGADLWLIRLDFTFEYPRPTMPNVVYIGGFQVKPSNPLPKELEEFVQSSGEHGVIIMTLGTLLNDLGPEVMQVFASAFANIPQKVVWRFNGKAPEGLGNNTMLLKWLPQNDLLGHPKTKAFVTHGGTNGIYEAIYHSVPILGVPLIFDQYDNIERMKARGVAEMLEVTALDVDSLTRALRNIVDPNKPYKENMHRLSQLHQDKPMKPMDTAVFWIEYVMRHKGAAHLRTQSYQLPWYAYYSLDVMLFFITSTVIVIGLVWLSVGSVIRYLKKIKKPKGD